MLLDASVSKAIGLVRDRTRRFRRESYAQRGRLDIDARFEQRKGFYVDIGAHHPFRFQHASFSKRGWHGKILMQRPARWDVSDGIVHVTSMLK
jgi:hypothetical protein